MRMCLHLAASRKRIPNLDCSPQQTSIRVRTYRGSHRPDPRDVAEVVPKNVERPSSKALGRALGYSSNEAGARS
eukprot:538279-Karenia_brevis.AAC.1